MKSELLDALYKKYEIASLSFGKIHDKLGDAYEEFCVKVLSDPRYLQMAKENRQADYLEFDVLRPRLQVRPLLP